MDKATQFAVIALGLLVLGLAVVMGLIIFSVVQDNFKRDECNAKGGYFQYHQCTDGPYGKVIVVQR